MPPIETLLYFVIVVVVIFALTIWILRYLAIDAMIKNVILIIEALVFLLWATRIFGIL